MQTFPYWALATLIVTMSACILVLTERVKRRANAASALKGCFLDGRGLECVLYYHFSDESSKDRLIFVFAGGVHHRVIRNEGAWKIASLPISDTLANFSFTEIERGARHLSRDAGFERVYPPEDCFQGSSTPEWTLLPCRERSRMPLGISLQLCS